MAPNEKRMSAMNMPFDRITVDPKVMNGQPCARGLRLTVRRVVAAVALYPDWDDLRVEYPELEIEDIRQALAFAACNLDDRIFPVVAA
jgi:uncharacterized protein (DUF433 family)